MAMRASALMLEAITTTNAISLATPGSACSPLTNMRAITATLVITGARRHALKTRALLSCITATTFEGQHRDNSAALFVISTNDIAEIGNLGTQIGDIIY